MCPSFSWLARLLGILRFPFPTWTLREFYSRPTRIIFRCPYPWSWSPKRFRAQWPMIIQVFRSKNKHHPGLFDLQLHRAWPLKLWSQSPVVTWFKGSGHRKSLLDMECWERQTANKNLEWSKKIKKEWNGKPGIFLIVTSLHNFPRPKLG